MQHQRGDVDFAFPASRREESERTSSHWPELRQDTTQHSKRYRTERSDLIVPGNRSSGSRLKDLSEAVFQRESCLDSMRFEIRHEARGLLSIR